MCSSLHTDSKDRQGQRRIALGRSGEPHRLYLASRTRVETPMDSVLYVPRHVSRILANDLHRAGIPRQTEKGKVDFHALRTTYINLVIASGATMPEAQELARYRTPALTIGIYSSSEDSRIQQLMDVLSHAIIPEEERAFGVHAQAAGDNQPSSLWEHGEEETRVIKLGLCSVARSPL